MKKYQAIPKLPIVFEAVQYTSEFNLESISDKCKEINARGRHFIDFLIKDDVLYAHKKEYYGIGMQYTIPVKLMSYLAFLEDDLLIFTEEEFKQNYVEMQTITS
jgi:hypothetical protein